MAEELPLVAPDVHTQIKPRQWWIFFALEKPATAADLAARSGLIETSIKSHLGGLVKLNVVSKVATPDGVRYARAVRLDADQEAAARRKMGSRLRDASDLRPDLVADRPSIDPNPPRRVDWTDSQATHKKKRSFLPGGAMSDHWIRTYCSGCSWEVKGQGRDIKAMYQQADRQWEAHLAPIQAAKRAQYESQLRARAAASKSNKTAAQLEASDNAWAGFIVGVAGLVILGLIIWGVVALVNSGSSSKCGYSPDAEPGSAQYERDREKAITGDC